MPRQRARTVLGGGERKPTLKSTPFPGLIDGNRWRIQEGRWPVFIDRSDLEGEGGVMQVPLDDTNVGRKLRLHEQAHVAFTPSEAEFEGVEAETVEACEDGRIIHLMNQREDWHTVNAGTDVMPPNKLRQHQEEFVQLGRKLLEGDESKNTIPLVEAARRIAMTRGYYEGQHFNDYARSAGLDWLVDEVNAMHRAFLSSKDRPTFEDTVNYARELERRCQEMEDAIIEANKEMQDADMPSPFREPPPKDGDLEWGEMRFQEAPMTEKLRGDPSRKQKPVDMGAVPRYMHRLLSDQRVFGRRRKHRAYQGTLLIDHSGSMHLRESEIDEILRRWPAVTIATYAGSGSGWGVLRVIAKNGRRAAQEYLSRPASGANEIDGPALDWLNKQKRPRVWISDGMVSGKYENFDQWFQLDAAKKVNRGKVKRIYDVHELLDS